MFATVLLILYCTATNKVSAASICDLVYFNIYLRPLTTSQDWKLGHDFLRCSEFDKASFIYMLLVVGKKIKGALRFYRWNKHQRVLSMYSQQMVSIVFFVTCCHVLGYLIVSMMAERR